jgi:drug/metabolite transporter (DMT)-like permease
MKAFRQLLALSFACMVGVLLPIAGTVYSHYHSSPKDSGLVEDGLLVSVQLVGFCSALVGLFVGGLGVGLLHLMRRFSFRDYALSGLGIGAAIGVLFTALTHHPGDPAISWVLFATLVALSMGLGFICYWSICVRSHAS